MAREERKTTKPMDMDMTSSYCDMFLLTL